MRHMGAYLGVGTCLGHYGIIMMALWSVECCKHLNANGASRFYIYSGPSLLRTVAVVSDAFVRSAPYRLIELALERARAGSRFGAWLDRTNLSAKLKSANIFVLTGWGQSAKFNSCQIFRLYGMLYGKSGLQARELTPVFMIALYTKLEFCRTHTPRAASCCTEMEAAAAWGRLLTTFSCILCWTGQQWVWLIGMANKTQCLRRFKA